MISHCANFLQNLEGSKIMKGQFVVSSRHNRLLDVRLQFEINKVTRLKLSFSYVFVSLRFLALLSSAKMLLEQLGHHFSVGEPVFKIIHSTGFNSINTQMPRLMAL